MPDSSVRTLSDVLQLHPLAALAWRTAVSAGQFLRNERPDELTIETKSTPTDAVTIMDRTAEQLISHALLGERPDDGLLGEEGGERFGTSGVRWIVDPLDGTVNYLFRLPMWGVSIAAEENGDVTLGVVVTPEFGEGYIGIRGRGAWRIVGPDAHPLQASSCTDPATALATTGFGYDPDARRRQSDVITGIIGEIRDVRRMGAAVVDFCWLARGRVDAYFESGLNPWDYSAGALIAREAGAVVTGLRDDDLSAFIFGAAPGIADALRQMLIDVNADRA